MTNYYVTFGQEHTHRLNNQTYDCDSILLVQAVNELTAREELNRMFEGKWSSIYTEEMYEKNDLGSYFPRGILNWDKPYILENELW